jgi:preprotein translocase subunit SecG
LSYFIGFLWVVYIFVCFILMFIILIQRGETGGLSSAFGGGGGETAFGVRADTAWKKATAIFAALFLGLSLLIGTLVRRESYGTVAAGTKVEEPAPPGPAQPVTPITIPAETPAPPAPPPPGGAAPLAPAGEAPVAPPPAPPAPPAGGGGGG